MLQLTSDGTRTSIPAETEGVPSNYPNPFNPEAWIPYQLKTPAAVSIAFTIHVAFWCVNCRFGIRWEVSIPRARAAYWDGRNTVGEPVASGLYFYTLTVGDFSATRRMVILK